MKESHPELTDEELEEKAKEEFELIMKARKKPYVKQINELTAETTTLERELEQREQLGREIGCRRVAINMLIDDVPIEVISKYTELSIEEIKELLESSHIS